MIDSPMPIATIQEHVARSYQVPAREIRSARRSRAIIEPRHVAMYLSKELTPSSLPHIGRFFGGRDHTTVLHAVRKIEDLRRRTPELDGRIRALMAELNPPEPGAEVQDDLFIEGDR